MSMWQEEDTLIFIFHFILLEETNVRVFLTYKLLVCALNPGPHPLDQAASRWLPDDNDWMSYVMENKEGSSGCIKMFIN